MWILITIFFKIRVGQFKEPFSFETYSSDRNIPFNELSMISCLVPSRDVGVMIHGNVWKDFLITGSGFLTETAEMHREEIRRMKRDYRKAWLSGRSDTGAPRFLDGLHFWGFLVKSQTGYL